MKLLRAELVTRAINDPGLVAPVLRAEPPTLPTAFPAHFLMLLEFSTADDPPVPAVPFFFMLQAPSGQRQEREGFSVALPGHTLRGELLLGGDFPLLAEEGIYHLHMHLGRETLGYAFAVKRGAGVGGTVTGPFRRLLSPARSR
jgi:hypothetical protein